MEMDAILSANPSAKQKQSYPTPNRNNASTTQNET